LALIEYETLSAEEAWKVVKGQKLERNTVWTWTYIYLF
jgi:hypothetical protein